MPVELKLVCPNVPVLQLVSSPSFGSPFAYDLSSASSQIETVSTIQLLPIQCPYIIEDAYAIDSSTASVAAEVTYQQSSG